MIAALFGPIKYGILPDHLARSELPAGNALVEGATFIAILLGTIVGGLAAKDGGDPDLLRAADDRVLAAVLGREPVHPAHRRRRRPISSCARNILASTIGLLRHLREDPRHAGGARSSRAGSGWSARSRSSLMPPLVKNVLGGDEEVVTACLAIFSISIAVGSGLAAWLAAGRIILLPTLIGAVLLGVFAIDLGLVDLGRRADRRRLSGIADVFGSLRGIRLAIDLAGLAIAGGLFIVPVFAAVQAWAGADRRARVVAARQRAQRRRSWRGAR